MRKVVEAVVDESLKTAKPVDNWEKDLTFDDKVFYYKGNKISTLSVEDLEDLIRYLDFKGIFKRWSLGKEEKKTLLSEIWKCIPNGYCITVFGERGVVTRGVKNSKNIVYTNYRGDVDKYDGSWYLGMKIDDKDSIILSKDEAPDNIKYTDISNSFGKKHTFGKGNTTTVGGGKKITYEDDTVVVYKNGKEVYKGLEDYEPMKRESWKWDNTKGYYTFKDYIKVCTG